MPDLPVTAPKGSQKDGDVDPLPVYQTHRGKQPHSREVGSPPPEHPRPDDAIVYED